MVIYKISVGDNSKNDPETRDKIKLLAYLTYGELLEYEEETERDILYKKNIGYNELYDGFRDRVNKYEFEHDDYYNGLYEPFMIDDNTFGFTALDNSISDEELGLLITEMEGIVSIKLEFHIEKIPAIDEDDRLNVIGSFYGYPNYEEKNIKKLEKIKKH